MAVGGLDQALQEVERGEQQAVSNATRPRAQAPRWSRLRRRETLRPPIGRAARRVRAGTRRGASHPKRAQPIRAVHGALNDRKARAATHSGARVRRTLRPVESGAVSAISPAQEHPLRSAPATDSSSPTVGEMRAWNSGWVPRRRRLASRSRIARRRARMAQPPWLPIGKASGGSEFPASRTRQPWDRFRARRQRSATALKARHGHAGLRMAGPGVGSSDDEPA